MLCKYHPKCKKYNCRFSHPIDKEINATSSNYINVKLSLNEESYIKNNILIYENNFFDIFNNIKDIITINEEVIDGIINNINSINILLISKLENLKTYKCTPKKETFNITFSQALKGDSNINIPNSEIVIIKDNKNKYIEKENVFSSNTVSFSDITNKDNISSFTLNSDIIENDCPILNKNNEVNNKLLLNPELNNTRIEKTEEINRKLYSDKEIKEKINKRTYNKKSLNDKINNTINKIKNYLKKYIFKDEELNNKIYKNNRDMIKIYSNIYEKYINNIIDKKELKSIQFLYNFDKNNFSRFINIMSIFYEISQNIKIMNSKLLFNYWSFKDLGKNEIISEILKLI